GTGWTCTVSSGTCTRTDALSAGQSFPPITVTGNVTASNGTPVSIPLNVSGGGISTPVTSTPTITVATPALTISKSHTGNFTLGQQGATYTVTVKNGTSAGATSAKVTVTETVPSGETLVSMAGTGWTCPGTGGANTCDRRDTLATNASYPGITVTVNVSATATSPQVNQVKVSGGGMSSAVSGSDSTTINLPDLSITKSHTGAFTAGTNATFNIGVSNSATAGPTAGAITVTDTLDSHFTFVSGSAAGWTCGAVSQVVTCTNPGPLAPGASATSIPLIVAVDASPSRSRIQALSLQARMELSISPLKILGIRRQPQPSLSLTLWPHNLHLCQVLPRDGVAAPRAKSSLVRIRGRSCLELQQRQFP